MNNELIFNNVKKMLEYRLNSNSLKFNITFKDYKDENNFQNVKMEIENMQNEGYIAKYYNNNNLINIAYLDFDINKIKLLIDDDKAIILYSIINRKLKKLITQSHQCQFFKSSLFLTDFKSNIYFTYCCKSNETNIENLQYISINDFIVQYNGFKKNDVILAINIVDSTLVLPQLRVVLDKD